MVHQHSYYGYSTQRFYVYEPCVNFFISYDELSYREKFGDEGANRTKKDHAVKVVPSIYQLPGPLEPGVLNPIAVFPVDPSADGECPTVESLISGLLPSDQQDAFIEWLRVTYHRALTHQPVLGQCLFLIGGKESETLLDEVISPILGGDINVSENLFAGKRTTTRMLETPVWSVDATDVPLDDEAIDAFRLNLNHALEGNFVYRIKRSEPVPMTWPGRVVVRTRRDSPLLNPDGVQIEFKDTAERFTTEFRRSRLVDAIRSELPGFCRTLLDNRPMNKNSSIAFLPREGIKKVYNNVLRRRPKTAVWSSGCEVNI